MKRRHYNRRTIGAPVDAHIVEAIDEIASKTGTDRASVIRWGLQRSYGGDLEAVISNQIGIHEEQITRLRTELAEFNNDIENPHVLVFTSGDAERIYRELLPHCDETLRQHLLKATLHPRKWTKIS